MGVIDVLNTRRSVRSFLPRDVPQATLVEVLESASRAPSGTNMQPWKVYVLTGVAKDCLVRDVLAMRAIEPHRERPPVPYGEYSYNPEPLFEPYLGRRRKVGWELYRLMGIAKGDRVASWEAAARNFAFFGAPVGLIFSIDRALQHGSWLDYGIFLQSLMLAASDKGLGTCAQAAWRHYHDVVRAHCSMPENEIVVCGMSLGYADPDDPSYQLNTDRAPVEEFATFLTEAPAVTGVSNEATS